MEKNQDLSIYFCRIHANESRKYKKLYFYKFSSHFSRIKKINKNIMCNQEKKKLLQNLTCEFANGYTYMQNYMQRILITIKKSII